MEKRKNNTSRFNMTLEKILEEVVNVTGVTVDDLKNRSRATEEIKEAKLLY